MTSEEIRLPDQIKHSSGNGTIIIRDGPLFDAANEEQFEIYIYPFIFTLVYMCVGFVGNFVVIYIFTCQWKLTKTTLFILTLAFVDIFSCMFNMPIEAVILWQPLNFDNDFLCKLSRYTTFLASAGSSFVLVAIAIDRYLMVCRPFKSRELGVPYAKKSCVIAVLLGVIVTWPSLIFYGTYKYYLVRNDGGTEIQIESKTCLITNYYTTNYTLPAAFYFFLLGGHFIIFVILTTVYIIIGRHLFIATKTDLSSKKRHSLKFFGISMMSAITGNIPHSQTHGETEGNRSRAVSADNIQVKIDPPSEVDCENGNVQTESCPGTPRRTGTPYLGHKILRNTQNGDNQLSVSSPTRLNTSNNQVSPVTEPKLSTRRNKKLFLNVDVNSDCNCGEFRRDQARLSTESVGSDKCLTPRTPRTPDSVRAIIYRSQSEPGSRTNLNKIISDELRNSEVKEFSLKRNTFIMRVVTMAFIVSFLPYLIIVTIRSSNTDIPHKLDKASQIAYHVFLRGYFINSMINPFIYGFLNEEFRLKLKSLFCKYCSSRFTWPWFWNISKRLFRMCFLFFFMIVTLVKKKKTLRGVRFFK